jgi:hypothetical protein
MVAAAGLWWAAEYPNAKGTEVVSRWGGLILAGLVVFWDAARMPHRRAQARAFWATLAVCMMGHLLLLGSLMWSVASWRVVWWAFVIPAEALLIRAIVRRFGTGPAGGDGS